MYPSRDGQVNSTETPTSSWPRSFETTAVASSGTEVPTVALAGRHAKHEGERGDEILLA